MNEQSPPQMRPGVRLAEIVREVYQRKALDAFEDASIVLVC